ncbi:MAG: sigma-70 family RNA polymerase sigma factor [Beijerinckiaceae bacterium]|nr:sigma-70 family RNA polymerase sigma factor [Beijerinckiaceae bacterium]
MAQHGAREGAATRPPHRFDEVVMPHLGDALALARWLTGNRHDAEDVVQEACIRALSGLSTYEGRGAKAWLLTIVRNTCFTWLARNRPKDLVLAGSAANLDEIEAGAASWDEGPEVALIRRAEEAAVQAAIAAVPPPFKEVLVLRDIIGLSYKEIAHMMEVPIGTIMSRLARGRSLVAAELGKVVA